jgi:hypothetical protein
MIYSLDTCDFAGGASVWDRMDLFYVLATKDSVDSYINWVDPGVFNLTNPGTTTYDFVKYQGITGSGDDYLSTNYDAANDATNFTLNSGTVGAYSRTNVNGNYSPLGIVNGNRIRILSRSGGNMSTYINSSNILTTATSTALGLQLATRTASNVVENYINGASLGAGTGANNEIPAGDIYILSYNNNGTAAYFYPGQLSIVFMMNGVTDAEAAAINTIIETYMDAIGVGVQ